MESAWGARLMVGSWVWFYGFWGDPRSLHHSFWGLALGFATTLGDLQNSRRNSPAPRTQCSADERCHLNVASLEGLASLRAECACAKLIANKAGKTHKLSYLLIQILHSLCTSVFFSRRFLDSGFGRMAFGAAFPPLLGFQVHRFSFPTPMPLQRQIF